MFENRDLKSFDIYPKQLYHYTNCNSLMKILESMTLKFSSFDNLNDLNETEVNFPMNDNFLGVSLPKFIINNCRLISFSRDYIMNSKIIEWGINRPRMWAQYADNNKGACIVLNEEKVLRRNSDLLKSKFHKIKNVNYKEWILSDFIETETDEHSILQKNYEMLFFQKHRDWVGDRERRLFLIGNIDFLDIRDCIDYVCLGSRFSRGNYLKLTQIIFANFKNRLQIFTPHDFAIQINQGGRVSAYENASRILELIRNQHEEVEKYFEYLNVNGYSI